MNENNTESQPVKTDYNKLTQAIKSNWMLTFILLNYAMNMGLSAWEMYLKDYQNACGSLMMANISTLFLIHLAVDNQNKK